MYTLLRKERYYKYVISSLVAVGISVFSRSGRKKNGSFAHARGFYIRSQKVRDEGRAWYLFTGVCVCVLRERQGGGERAKEKKR